MILKNKDPLHVIMVDILIIAFAIVYSLIRYYLNYYRIPNPDIFYFINKGLAICSAIGISISYLIGNLNKLQIIKKSKHISKSKYFGTFGFFTAALHILLSLMLLSSSRFPYLYQSDGNFNFNGEMTILFGVTSFALFMMPAITTIASVRTAMTHKSWKRYQQIGYLGSMILFIHILSADFVNISHPLGWRYLLIPISILAWLLIVSSLILKLIIIVKELIGRLKLNAKIH